MKMTNIGLLHQTKASHINNAGLLHLWNLVCLPDKCFINVTIYFYEIDKYGFVIIMNLSHINNVNFVTVMKASCINNFSLL